ncbi:Peptidase_C39 like family protein [Aquimarina amphilecti]|uniref:Peptidase_C39 like family protein n=1 Tax=Aquimarina amphilecti TaxID=1038014 RepID=A0A1H7G5D7_AQUAM|nr:papain-like cysteine protease family protein [Aquimarina amphilecti]SEK33523.1 Peptidase_C39 like family protein [Aquimarina amphilecti]
MGELTSSKKKVTNVLSITPEEQIGSNNCWAAALSMALQSYGTYKSEKILDEMFEANNQGLDLFTLHPQISTHFSYINSEYRSLISGNDPKLSFNEIQGQIDSSRPILIGTQNYNGFMAHALLITGYTDDNTVLIIDPWVGALKEIELQELENYWVETIVFDK